MPLEWLFRAPQVVSPRDDSFAQMRARIAEIAESRNEWAGMPTLMDDLSFHIEPSYPYADAFAEDEIRDDDEALTAKLRNMFWSWRLRMWIFVYEKDGKITFGTSHNNRMRTVLDTLVAQDAWGLEQEMRALALLKTLVNPRQFKAYLLTGTFGETSKRSDVFYVFRRLGTTVAVRLDDPDSRVLCCLCMHPIGYYRGTWAGAMAPTDDVIAHLMMMRADEHMYWRRAKQHPAWDPLCGV